jgi:uncharacterized protein YaiL (DUF2058 family)
MGNSLRDELLKAGLASEERPEKPRRSKRRKAGPGKKRQQAPAQSDSEGAAATSAHVLRENRRRTARFVRDSTLAGGSVAENAKKALRRKIQELIKAERLNDAQAAIAYHFVRGKRIKRIYVTEDQRAQLTAGTMVVAALEGNNHLLTCSAAEQLLSLAPQTVVCGATEAAANEATSNAGQGDGGGEEHPVPDDIVW